MAPSLYFKSSSTTIQIKDIEQRSFSCGIVYCVVQDTFLIFWVCEQTPKVWACIQMQIIEQYTSVMLFILLFIMFAKHLRISSQ